ncbi:MAG: FAD-dependent oxidoreductase [Deltaproteobacteria bacterium]|nr:FAD-dependent oxidoreductase [Deltaproteobacteria bacterium]
MSELDLSPDVVVIGGGIAGALAAVRARERGARVVLVHRPGGGTVASSGAIDCGDELCGLVPGPAVDPLDRGGRWRRGVDLLAARHPQHPFARVGDKGRERVREALALLKQLAQHGGLDLAERDDGHNHVLATQLGTVKRAALVQKCQLLDVAALEPDATVAVVDPLDLAGFGARAVSHVLGWIAGMSARKLTVTTLGVERALPASAVHDDALAMARALDDDATRAAFCEALRNALRRAARPAHHLLLPPILGVEKHAAVLNDVERAAGRPVKELLALPPSAPGVRLARALLRGAKERGVVVVEARAHATSAHGTRVATVAIEGQQLKAELTPRSVVLATGRFYGGGIVRDQVAREPLFGLPVVTEGHAVDDAFIGLFTGDSPEAEHAIFRAGVAVDASLTPVDRRGKPLFENLLCAGTVVEGWDPARDGAAGGVAALTGLLAGEAAALVAGCNRSGPVARAV